MSDEGPTVRVATTADADAIAETVALAFLDCPTWGPGLRSADGTTDHLAPYWRLFVTSALPHGHVHLVDGEAGRVASVAIWLPPGEPELTPDDEARAFEIVRAALSPEGAEAFFTLWDRFEAAHPREAQPHAYLTILATHPLHRGHGLAQRMLAADLAAWDAAGVPSYLESSNPDNDRRYERQGYRTIGRIEPVYGDHRIAAMWREVPR